jgi:hypothetical protein
VIHSWPGKSSSSSSSLLLSIADLPIIRRTLRRPLESFSGLRAAVVRLRWAREWAARQERLERWWRHSGVECGVPLLGSVTHRQRPAAYRAARLGIFLPLSAHCAMQVGKAEPSAERRFWACLLGHFARNLVKHCVHFERGKTILI